MEDTPQSIVKVGQVITLFEDGSVDRVSGSSQATAALTGIDNLIPFLPLPDCFLGLLLILPFFLPPSQATGTELIKTSGSASEAD